MPKKTAQWPSEKERPLILCHFGEGEIQGMDDLQGGPSYDEYGIREYSKLGKIIKIPEIRNLFLQTTKYSQSHKGELPPQVESAYEKVKPYTPEYPESEKENQYSMIKELKERGVGGDKEIAWVPEDFVEFLIELGHEVQVNPHTGFLMFSWWKKALRVIGAIGGAFLGGPIGAGIGSFAARHATGQHGSKAFRGAFGDFGKAGLLSGIGGALGSAFPGIGSTASGLLPSGLTSGMGNFFNGPMSTMGMLRGAGSMLGFGNSGMGGQAPANGPWSEAVARQRGMELNPRSASGGIFSGLGNLLGGSNLLMPAVMGGMHLYGKHQEHKDRMNAYNNAMNRFSQQKNDMGMNEPWVEQEAIPRERNPAFWNRSPDDIERGIFPSPFIEGKSKFASGGHASINHAEIRSHKQGALIKGPGKGQADKINTSVPENSYILDATTVSSFGDGSSEAGGNILKKFEHEVKSRYGKPHREVVEEYSRQLPVYLSNDEYKFDPNTVTAIGRGNNDRGAKVLKSMVLQLRKDKAQNGMRLAPKAKDPVQYMEKAFQQLMKGNHYGR